MSPLDVRASTGMQSLLGPCHVFVSSYCLLRLFIHACLAGAIVSPLDVRASTDNRDALAKTLYSRIFDWLVAKVNSSIGQDPNAQALIGVLDIYGILQVPNPEPSNLNPEP